MDKFIDKTIGDILIIISRNTLDKTDTDPFGEDCNIKLMQYFLPALACGCTTIHVTDF